jgi:hypothetical protein
MKQSATKSTVTGPNEVREMNTYETTATVEDQGQVRVCGVPLPRGTKVQVTIKPEQNGGPAPVTAATDRASRLFAALDKARNTEPVGPLRREELYDRKVLR